MAEHIDFEIEVSDTENTAKDGKDEVCSEDSLTSFINDSSDDDEKGNEESFYRKCGNMKTSVDEILKQEYDKSIQDIDNVDLANLCETSVEENEVDQFKESEKRLEKFTETLFPISKTDQNLNSLISAILFNIRYILENKTDVCNVDDLQLSINNNFLFDELYENEKLELVLDYQKSDANCHKTNSLLAKNDYFLRIFELRENFCYLSLKKPKKQTIVRQLSSCINEKYNCFHLISIEYSKKLRKKFQQIDMIYKLVKTADEKIFNFQSHIVIHVETMKQFHMDLHLSVTTGESFLQEQISKKDTLKIAVILQFLV